MKLSCSDLQDRQLSVSEALSALLSMAPEAVPAEPVALTDLLGRVLSEDLISPLNVPQNTNAAMDGIAVAWPDTPPEHWHLAGEVLAGEHFAGTLGGGEAVVITTGAPLPEGADTVIMREQLACEESRVRVLQPDRVQKGQNVRRAGEDLARGTLALTRGTRIRPQHLGLVASLGLAQVNVHRRLRVAIFSTGDEVSAPGEPLTAAGIYDANRFTLKGLLNRLDCDVLDMGILRDDARAIAQALSHASDAADMVLSSGGVSVGQADWIKPALQQVHGELGFWRIAMRPGRPLAFGWLGAGAGRLPFFGLPGNPVAVMVTFLQFVQPLLRRLQGEAQWQPARLCALAAEPLHSREGRTDYQRGVYSMGEDGRLWVRTTGPQGSGMLSSMVTANCLIEIAPEHAEIGVGIPVTIQPFGDLI
ncbi:bifunctional molybdopterin-guanine dinucleotide biosynthesis adaptor protein MobB/molybdopterin molybdotransferase MoeA [Halomonas shantousis]